MDIKIVMHSTLDCHLKPDLKLIFDAIDKIKASGKDYNRAALHECENAAMIAAQAIAEESMKNNELKKTTDKELREKLMAEKAEFTQKADEALEAALTSLNESGGGDEYHYNYDIHYNRVVAGLMGSTCYMKDDFEALQNKGIRNILAIASQVENNGHHSTFGHSHVTLEITGLPKALAMVLNNEKEYCTSEKSARYTIMHDVEPTQNALYDKWKEIFEGLIKKEYGACKPFFTDLKIRKLAQENARYMLSVFTPSNMVYTTSIRQLNYLAHWLEAEIANPNSNRFYQGIKKEMQEFVDFVKDNGMYSETLEDHKDRKLSLFGRGILKNNYAEGNYALKYYASWACLAQAHRHRTIDYHVNEFLFNNKKPLYYDPPIIISAIEHDNTLPNYYDEWYNDLLSVEEFLPQGQMVEVIERGTVDNFIIKAMERECSMAQLEINNITKWNSWALARFVGCEIDEGEKQIEKIKNGVFGSSEDSQLEIEDIKHTLTEFGDMQKTLQLLEKGARCTAGYK